jgi:hypothetical protein
MNTNNNPAAIVGVWESVNLNPTVIITHNCNGKYWIIFLHMNEHSKQASPAIFEVEQDKIGIFISSTKKRIEIKYDSLSDTLSLSNFGDYMRN